MPIVRGIFLIYGFVIQVIGEKTLCIKRFTRNLGDIFYIKMIATIILTNYITNLLLSLFCSF